MASSRQRFSVADLTDSVIKLDVLIDELDHRKKLLNAERDVLCAQAKELLERQDNTVVRGKLGTGEIKERWAPKIDDYPTFQKWVVKTGHLEILQNRLSKEAYTELKSNGERPLGVRVDSWTEFTVKRSKKKAK